MKQWTFAGLDQEWCHPTYDSREEAAEAGFGRLGSPVYVGVVNGTSIDNKQMANKVIKP